MAQQAGSKPDVGASAATGGTDGTPAQPIVYEKKRKKKYSSGLREPQKMEQCVTRAAEKLAQAVADGVSEYRERSSESARKKRDGAARDVVRNVGHGLEKAIEKAAKAPTELTKRISMRRLARLVIPPPFSAFVR